MLSRTEYLYGEIVDKFPEQEDLAKRKIFFAKQLAVKLTNELNKKMIERKDHKDFVDCVELQERIESVYKAIEFNKRLLKGY